MCSDLLLLPQAVPFLLSRRGVGSAVAELITQQFSILRSSFSSSYDTHDELALHFPSAPPLLYAMYFREFFFALISPDL